MAKKKRRQGENKRVMLAGVCVKKMTYNMGLNVQAIEFYASVLLEQLLPDK